MKTTPLQLSRVLLLSALLSLAGLPEAETRSDNAAMTATIWRTSYGVPHIRSGTLAGAGFGLGYAFAEDNACMMADRWVTVGAERSRHFGPKGGNLESDLFWQLMIDQDIVGKALTRDPPLGVFPEVQELVRGYVAGYNRYLEDVDFQLGDPNCENATWIRPITTRDVYLQALHWSLLPTLLGQAANMAAASPPGVSASSPASSTGILREPIEQSELALPASNMVALGSEATDNGRGMLFANPHWVWSGPDKFYEAHLTVPGQLNVYGMTFMGLPIVVIGHTEHVAWSHTVSTAGRSSVYRLDLVSGSPTSYRVDGEVFHMEPIDVTVDGVSHTFWKTDRGFVVETGAWPWTEAHAYTLRSKDLNLRLLNQDFAYARAATVEEMHKSGGKILGWGWLNTVAADSAGGAYFAPLQSVPYLSDQQLAGCDLGSGVLDGSRSACDWQTSSAAPEPGIYPVDQLPSLFRVDYTTNSNDSHWTTNLRELMEGYPTIMGPERTARSLRTREGLEIIESRLQGMDGLPGNRFTLDQLIDKSMSNRVHLALLWRDELAAYCESLPDEDGVADACPVLAAWDLTYGLDSPGAVLFRRFAERAGTRADRFTVPFQPADPVNTPRGLNTPLPQIRTALIGAVDDLRAAGFPLDAVLRNREFAIMGDERISIPGGPGEHGVYNNIESGGWIPGVGWPRITHGSSFIMWVQFTDRGPVGQSILTYSQSENPTSPHFADQTRLFSEKQFKPIRFTEADIARDPNRTVKIVNSRKGR